MNIGLLIASIVALIGLGLWHRIRTYRLYSQAHDSAALDFVVDFWTQRLSLAFKSIDESGKRQAFGQVLREKLAAAYAKTKRFPYIGVFHYNNHNHFGVDDLMWSALKAVGLTSEARRHTAHLENIQGIGGGEMTGRMEISLQEVQFLHVEGPGSFTIWQPQQAVAAT